MIEPSPDCRSVQRGVIQTPRDRKDRKEKPRLTSTQVWGGQAACRGPERAGPPHGWQGAAEPGFRARRRRRLQIPRRPQDRAANAAGPVDAIAREAPRRCRPRLVRRPVCAKPPRQRDSHRARVHCTHRVCAPPSSRHGARAPRGLEQTRVTSPPHEAPPVKQKQVLRAESKPAAAAAPGLPKRLFSVQSGKESSQT